MGVVDKLSVYFDSIRGPLASNCEAGDFVQHGLALFISLIRLLSKRFARSQRLLQSPHFQYTLASCRTTSVFSSAKLDDPTQLLTTFQATDLCGIVSLMYGVLLHGGSPSRSDSNPPQLPIQTLTILTSGFKMLNQLATLDLALLQVRSYRTSAMFLIQVHVRVPHFRVWPPCIIDDSCHLGSLLLRKAALRF